MGCDNPLLSKLQGNLLTGSFIPSQQKFDFQVPLRVLGPETRRLRSTQYEDLKSLFTHGFLQKKVKTNVI